MISREEADEVLAELGVVYDRLAAGMYALDSHPGLAILRDSSLVGDTAEAARTVHAHTDLLWASFTALREHLERARAIRAAHARPGDEELAELTRLLRDPVIELDDDGMPLEPGATAAPARWLPLAELAELIGESCAEVTDLLSDVDEAVTACSARLLPVNEALGRARALAAELGEHQDYPARLDRLAAEFADVRDRALSDPLALAGVGAPGALDARLRRIGADIDAAFTRLTALARLRDEHPRRLARLREAVEAVATMEAEAGRAYATVRVKIALPGLPPAPARAAGLRDSLAALAPLVREGRWARLGDALAELDRTVAEARGTAVALRDAADGLMARRAELRGRLDAYRAKAAGLGFAEDAQLAARHATAHDLLYTSPCDLPAATRAIAAYQRSLAELSAVPTQTRGPGPERRDRTSEQEPST